MKKKTFIRLLADNIRNRRTIRMTVKLRKLASRREYRRNVKAFEREGLLPMKRYCAEWYNTVDALRRERFGL
jgi:hypothetical protein